MTDETLEKMWNILKENAFQIDVAVKSEIICTSCKNILIKPCNVPCGCRYCYDCLISYLNREEKFCLGESEYCKKVLINIDKNVCNDQVANIKISRIVVKCPLESCEFETELGKMENHRRTCDRQPVTCPYNAIGCHDDKIDVDKMKQHLKQENYCHARLLMDFVDNWRNEMKLLKTNMRDLQEENKCTKEQMESNQKTILALEDSVAKLLKENKSLKELETEKSHQNNQIEAIILAMQTKTEEQKQEIKKNTEKIENLKQRFDEKWNQIEKNQEPMKIRINKITQENVDIREELEMVKLDNKVKEKIISARQTKLEEEEKEIGKVKEKCEFLEENQEQMKTRIEKIFQETKSLRNKLETVKQHKTKQEPLLSFQTKTEEQKQGIKTNTEKIEDLKQRFDEKWNQEQMKIRIDKMTRENADMATQSKHIKTKLTQPHANQICGEFLWCIKNWKEKKERAEKGIEAEIYSDPFYSHKNGYKMCLKLFPGGSAYLVLCICIMRGEFDNNLQWPFRHEVKLDLLNQKTNLAYVSMNVCSKDNPNDGAWKKPTSERNEAYCGGHLIKQIYIYAYKYGFLSIEQSELSSNADLYQGDQILIKATSLMKP